MPGTRNRDSNGLWMLAGLMLAEVLVSLLAESDVARAAAVASVLMIFMFIALAEACLSSRFVVPKATGAHLVLALLVVAGTYATLLGAVRGNSPYYMGADLYHWWVELFFVAYLTYVAARRIDAQTLIRSIILVSFVLGVLTLLAVLLGSVGLISTGGHKVAAINVFRLDGGRGYPLLLLLLLFATTKATMPLPQIWRLTRFAAGLMLLLALLFTLKRALWLTFLCSSMILILPKRVLRVGLYSVPLIVLGVWSLFLFFPNFAFGVVKGIAEGITYNPNYTVEDSLAERVQQLVALVPYMSNPFGYGFGAEFYAYWPGGNENGYVHYIHSLYVYHLLQLGYAGVALFVIAYGIMLTRLWSEIGRRTEYEWLARGAFAATMSMLVTGLTMNSTHTVFNGLVFGLGLMVAVSARRRPRVDTAVSRRGTGIANSGSIYS